MDIAYCSRRPLSENMKECVDPLSQTITYKVEKKLCYFIAICKSSVNDMQISCTYLESAGNKLSTSTIENTIKFGSDP